MRVLYLSTVSIFILSACAEGAADDVTTETGKALYNEYCASCHGVGLKAGSAPSLFDSDWTHGADLASIRKNIADGIEDLGMPGFASGFTDAQIEDVLVYIKSGAPEDTSEETVSDFKDTSSCLLYTSPSPRDA